MHFCFIDIQFFAKAVFIQNAGIAGILFQQGDVGIKQLHLGAADNKLIIDFGHIGYDHFFGDLGILGGELNGGFACKKTDEDFAAAKDALAKNTTKIAELEKARSESAARVNELTAEVAKLRDGSEVRDANAKSKKAEADLEAASSALREANSKMAEIEKTFATLTEENNRLKARSREIGSGSTPDHRPL